VRGEASFWIFLRLAERLTFAVVSGPGTRCSFWLMVE